MAISLWLKREIKRDIRFDSRAEPITSTSSSQCVPRIFANSCCDNLEFHDLKAVGDKG